MSYRGVYDQYASDFYDKYVDVDERNTSIKPPLDTNVYKSGYILHLGTILRDIARADWMYENEEDRSEYFHEEDNDIKDKKYDLDDKEEHKEDTREEHKEEPNEDTIEEEKTLENPLEKTLETTL
jgi:hypothetical protein